MKTLQKTIVSKFLVMTAIALAASCAPQVAYFSNKRSININTNTAIDLPEAGQIPIPLDIRLHNGSAPTVHDEYMEIIISNHRYCYVRRPDSFIFSFKYKKMPNALSSCASNKHRVHSGYGMIEEVSAGNTVGVLVTPYTQGSIFLTLYTY